MKQTKDKIRKLLYNLLSYVFTEMYHRIAWKPNDGTYMERTFIRKKRKTWGVIIFYKVSEKEPKEYYLNKNK